MLGVVYLAVATQSTLMVAKQSAGTAVHSQMLLPNFLAAVTVKFTCAEGHCERSGLSTSLLVLPQPDVCAQFDAETLSQAAASAFAEASSNGEGESSAAADAAASVLASEYRKAELSCTACYSCPFGLQMCYIIEGRGNYICTGVCSA
jgi:hypothetical protein